MQDNWIESSFLNKKFLVCGKILQFNQVHVENFLRRKVLYTLKVSVTWQL